MKAKMKTAFSLLAVLILTLGFCAGAAADGSWTCPDCGTENAMNFCTKCGAKRPETVVCGSCGYETDAAAGYTFCPNCGAKLETEAPQEDEGITFTRCGVFYENESGKNIQIGCYANISLLPSEGTVGLFYELTFSRDVPEGYSTLLTAPDGQTYSYRNEKGSAADSVVTFYTCKSTDLTTLKTGTYTLAVNGREAGSFQIQITGEERGSSYIAGDSALSVPVAGIATRGEDGTRFFRTVNQFDPEELEGTECGVYIRLTNISSDRDSFSYTLSSDNGDYFYESRGDITSLKQGQSTNIFIKRKANELAGWYLLQINGRDCYAFEIKNTAEKPADDNPKYARNLAYYTMLIGRISSLPDDEKAIAMRLWNYFEIYGHAGHRDEPACRGYVLMTLTAEQAAQVSGIAGEKPAAGIAHMINSQYNDTYTSMADKLAGSGTTKSATPDAAARTGAEVLAVFFDRDIVLSYTDYDNDTFSSAFIISDPGVFSRITEQALLEYTAMFGISSPESIRIVSMEE